MGNKRREEECGEEAETSRGAVTVFFLFWRGRRKLISIGERDFCPLLFVK